MNYWERQKSFWKTPIGIIMWIFSLTFIIVGALLALNIFISPFPIIESFHARPVILSPGEASNLSWSVLGATSIEIRPGIGLVESKGVRIVSPTQTTIYKLIALNDTRNRSAEVRIIVKAEG